MTVSRRRRRLMALGAIVLVGAVVTVWWIVAVFAGVWPFDGRLAWRFTPLWAALVAAFTLAATLTAVHLAVLLAQDVPPRPTRRELAGLGEVERARRIRDYRRAGLKGLVVGNDGRTSTSQLQVAIWTLALAFGLLMLIVVGRTPNCPLPAGAPFQGDCPLDDMRGISFASLLGRDFRWEYLFLLGWPLALAITAKRQVYKALDSINEVNEAHGVDVPAGTPAALETDTAARVKAPPTDANEVGWVAGLRQAISDDHGRLALMDAQYFLFTVITIGYFLLQLVTHPREGLPEIPATLIVLMGVSGGGYLSGKLLDPVDVKGDQKLPSPTPPGA
ncbi:hypothetical protein [Nonomuraea sp. NPDC049725]|uniref:hypothetical protein n=1 Tax=Nonomuraea sp. NPDC049725 TaxID=3154508 RepID=UPI00342473B6